MRETGIDFREWKRIEKRIDVLVGLLQVEDARRSRVLEDLEKRERRNRKRREYERERAGK